MLAWKSKGCRADVRCVGLELQSVLVHACALLLMSGTTTVSPYGYRHYRRGHAVMHGDCLQL